LQISSEIERKNIQWQDLRKRLKREYNRDKAAYDEALEEYMRVCEEASVDSYSDSDDGTGSEVSVPALGDSIAQGRPPKFQEESRYALPPPAFDMEPPVEADYAALEERHFGALTHKLELLKVLHKDVCRLTDDAMQTLRLACVNISQKVRSIYTCTLHGDVCFVLCYMLYSYLIM